MTDARDITDDYLAHIDRALERELLYGCTEHDIRQELRLDARSTFASHRAAVDLIRELRESPDLRVWYSTSKRHELSPNDTLIDVYVDENDYQYWIEPRSLAIVQSFSAKDPYQAARQARTRKERPSVAPIREKAVSLLKRLVPSFEDRYTQLHPFEGNDGGYVYHFRWDDYTSPVAESEDAPFVHISLSADGRLQSFTNTLSSAS
jgi:hypothetical protein